MNAAAPAADQEARMKNDVENNIAPPCLGEALRRGTLPSVDYISF